MSSDKNSIQSREQDVGISNQLKTSYLTYAMSVIVGRALPDVRDGLKPVHRRILYAMYDKSWRHDKSYVKSAKIVGEVIGNFHPHGDTAVYDTLVRMAQKFSLREVLIDGQGNFGSVDGDPPAAYRYTEARLTAIAETLLHDLEKDTVSFTPNFDDSRREPTVLPAAFPNLLVNGSSGIAVGMATKIPPHNLSEVIQAIEYLIDYPDASVVDLTKFVKAPDFPTGGIIIGKGGLEKAYHTGRGSIMIRSQTHMEDISKSRKSIIVTEIPYEIKKNDLVARIAELANQKKIDGITGIQDESDRTGMRIVITLRKDCNEQIVLNQLFQKTSMQISYGIIFLAIVNQEPKLLNLQELLSHYLSHRIEVVTNRIRYELNKAEKRSHILEGLKIALDAIDLVIKIIRASANVSEARASLIQEFRFSEEQANAILEMRLQKLTSLEIQKIIEELELLRKKIEEFQILLSDKGKLMELIKTELKEVSGTFSNERKSVIEDAEKEDLSFEVTDLIENQEEVITLSHGGYIRRVAVDTFKRQKRGGQGVVSGGKREDMLRHIHFCLSHDFIIVFSNKGKVFYLRTYDIPQSGKDIKGKHVRSLFNLSTDEALTTLTSTPEINASQVIVLLTKLGTIKKMLLHEIRNAKRSGVLALQFKNKQDSLMGATILHKAQEYGDIFIASDHGLGIRTNSHVIRSQGRVASGISGITLPSDIFTVGLSHISSEEDFLFVITQHGYAKRVNYSEFNTKNRGGKGMCYCKVSSKTGKVVAIASVKENDEVIITTVLGMTLRTIVSKIPVLGRNASGVIALRLKNEQDHVSDIAILPSTLSPSS